MLPFPEPRSAHDIHLLITSGCEACNATGRRPGTSSTCGGCNGTARAGKSEINLFQFLELLTSAAGELDEQTKKAANQ